ncbi:MAG: hypothetical protein AAF550_11490 [Myxococcota bacterium]
MSRRNRFVTVNMAFPPEPFPPAQEQVHRHIQDLHHIHICAIAATCEQLHFLKFEFSLVVPSLCHGSRLRGQPPLRTSPRLEETHLGDMIGWLETPAASFVSGLDTPGQRDIDTRSAECLRPSLQASEDAWVADHVR